LAKTWALGAKIYGAKIHGANDPGAMPLYLSADDYDTRIMVYFLKSFRKKHI
jgi:hypothetical protein